MPILPNVFEKKKDSPFKLIRLKPSDTDKRVLSLEEGAYIATSWIEIDFEGTSKKYNEGTVIVRYQNGTAYIMGHLFDNSEYDVGEVKKNGTAAFVINQGSWVDLTKIR